MIHMFMFISISLGDMRIKLLLNAGFIIEKNVYPHTKSFENKI